MDLTGQKLGKYELIKHLGRGGMADVYQAVQPVVERDVALKVLHRHMADDEGFLERFQSEAKGIGKLDHPNIVRVIDYDIDNGDYYIVLDYIAGGTLRTYLKKKGVLSAPEALHIMAQLTDAVGYAHQRGLIHRDIKPDNILLANEMTQHVVLTDFGLARLHDGPNITIQGAVIGTAAYVSPEALNGNVADERSDIYSLGIVLYQMMTGSTPYEASNAYGMMLKQLNDPLPPPREKNPDISPEMESLILKAIEKEPSDRFQITHEFHMAVKQMQEGQWEQNPPQTPQSTQPLDISNVPDMPKMPKMPDMPSMPKTPKQRNPFLAAALGVVLAAFVTVFILYLVPYVDEMASPGSNEEPSTAMAQTPQDESVDTTTETQPDTETNGDTAVSTSQAADDSSSEVMVSETAMSEQAVMGVFRFLDNDIVQAGDIELQINQITPAPEGSHYELLLMGQNSDMVLNLGELQVENDQIDFTHRTEENLLARYHQVAVSLVSDDSSSDQSTVFMGALDGEYINQLRPLLVNDDTTGFLPKVIEQSELANQQATMLQSALRANDLPEVKRYTEQLVNILVGKNDTRYGDLNGDGKIENPGNGFGVQKYLRGIKAQTQQVVTIAETTEAQQARANELIALSESGLTAFDTSLELALELLQITKIDDNTATLTGKLEWYVLELLEGPVVGEAGGMLAAYEYGLQMAEINLY